MILTNIINSINNIVSKDFNNLIDYVLLYERKLIYNNKIINDTKTYIKRK